MTPFAFALLALAGAPSPGPAPECRVEVLRQVTDDVGNVWTPGTSLPVDIERDGQDGGAYCAHGGSCLPRRRDGRELVRLKGCRVGPSIGGGDHRLVRRAPGR